ncbi:hypothetical protein EB001_12200 [bacterium]|jgi:hypothetical protein|nr:hypothetical protein [bacterium]
MKKFRVLVKEEIKDWVLKEYHINAESKEALLENFDTKDFWENVTYVDTLDRDYNDETTGFVELDEIEEYKEAV